MTRYEEILLQLYEILKSYAKDGQSLSEGTELLSDLGLDSMKVMQLLLETEERFDISIPLNIIPNVRTARDFARQIEQLTEQR
jgi:acyl carrier protein